MLPMQHSTPVCKPVSHRTAHKNGELFWGNCVCYCFYTQVACLVSERLAAAHCQCGIRRMVYLNQRRSMESEASGLQKLLLIASDGTGFLSKQKGRHAVVTVGGLSEGWLGDVLLRGSS